MHKIRGKLNEVRQALNPMLFYKEIGR